jgi:hypothetical protein
MTFTLEQKTYCALNFLVIVGLCASAITASKIIQIGTFVFPCSNIIFSLLTFPVTDVISEIWGSKEAKRTVWISFAAQVLFVLMVQGSVHLPGATSWGNQDAYQLILGSGPRIVAASMVAFLTSQIWDVVVYDRLKALTKGRYLLLRNNLSTFTSQLLNSALFITIAFYGSQPLLPLIFGSIALKWAIAAIDTPFVYWGVRWIDNALDGKTRAYQAG